jgi:predicted aspartyl protease
MIARVPYDASVDPPAPMVPVRIAGPVGDEAVMLPMLVDTGAECTLVPALLVRQLGLPQIDVIGVTGVGGGRTRTAVHAASVELGGLRMLARIVAFADEAILGRDILNQAVVTLDGPGLAISIDSRASKRAGRSAGGRARGRRPRRGPSAR